MNLLAQLNRTIIAARATYIIGTRKNIIFVCIHISVDIGVMYLVI